MTFHKQRDRRFTNIRVQSAQQTDPGDDQFEQFKLLAEENESHKASRRDRRLNKRLFKRDPYAE